MSSAKYNFFAVFLKADSIIMLSNNVSRLLSICVIIDKTNFLLHKNRNPDGLFWAPPFLLPPRIGGIIFYEENKPIRGIGAIEKRHQMGMLSFTDG